MAEPAVRTSGHRVRWRWLLVGLVVFVIGLAVAGYQMVPLFSDWVNDVLGSLSVGE